MRELETKNNLENGIFDYILSEITASGLETTGGTPPYRKTYGQL